MSYNRYLTIKTVFADCKMNNYRNKSEGLGHLNRNYSHNIYLNFPTF